MVKLYIIQVVMRKTNLKNSNRFSAVNSHNQFIERQHRDIFSVLIQYAINCAKIYLTSE